MKRIKARGNFFYQHNYKLVLSIIKLSGMRFKLKQDLKHDVEVKKDFCSENLKNGKIQFSMTNKSINLRSLEAIVQTCNNKWINKQMKRKWKGSSVETKLDHKFVGGLARVVSLLLLPSWGSRCCYNGQPPGSNLCHAASFSKSLWHSWQSNSFRHQMNNGSNPAIITFIYCIENTKIRKRYRKLYV